MKRLSALALLAGLALSACGSAPGQITGNNRVSIGVDAGDAGSEVTVTKTFTPGTPGTPAVPPSDANPGGTPAVPPTPARTEWTTSEAGPVAFTFMTRPGSDAVYITGWRITRYDFNGRVSTEVSSANKIDIYVPSGWTCPERQGLPAYQSCQMYGTDGKLRADVQPANGLPTSSLNLNFAGALVEEVRRTNTSAYSSIDIEFTGESSNGHPVVVKANNISSRAVKNGDQ